MKLCSVQHNLFIVSKMDMLNLASRPSPTSLVEQLLQAPHIKGKSKSCSALFLSFSLTQLPRAP